MMKNVNDLIDWADVEEICYSESAHPDRILGRHRIESKDVLQAYLPGAIKVSVLFKNKPALEMELVDSENFWFAVLLDSSYQGIYQFQVSYSDGTVSSIYDPYFFPLQIKQEDIVAFEQGIHYDIYQVLGAHPMTIDGVKGTQFAVWAPNAMRVSVVGDFNLWDGRRHQMRKNACMFELFIPQVGEGDIYKFEVKFSNRLVSLKSDPYGFAAELRPSSASVVTNIDKFKWSDANFIKSRKKRQVEDSAISVYEVYLGSFATKEDGGYLNYTEIAPKLAEYAVEMGYTHVELMPIMEHPFDGSWGYQTIGYYAPTSRYGTAKDFASFVNILHKAGIGVILDWVPAHFPKDNFGLSYFDGTNLYEPANEKMAHHPHWGTYVFDYGRPEVRNYLIANALYWIEKYHIDGIRVDAVASMLYLDYGRNDGEWVANAHGGKENLDAVEFIKHLNSIVHKRNENVLTIAEESTSWPLVTGKLEEGGLGFDMKWNMGFMNDYLQYITKDPYFRSYEHDNLTFSMIYSHFENFMLVFSHDEVVHGKGSMLGKMPGDEIQKFAALRATFAYMMMHPGKKLFFMGQDIGEYDEFSESRTTNFELLEFPLHKGLQSLVKDLNSLYKASTALTQLDRSPEGFTWTNCYSWKDCFVSFVRKGKKKDDMLFIVANFSGIDKSMTVGVPLPGKYKEILNTDSIEYGGTGCTNPRVKKTKEMEWDQQANSFNLKIAAQSVVVMKYEAFTKEELEKKPGKEKKEMEDVGRYTKRAVPTKKK